MTDAVETALAAAEDDVATAVATALDEVADEFAQALTTATELVAARFSVSRIAGMWQARVPGLVRRLLGAAQTAAEHAADQVDATLPDGWDDLPGRQERGDSLPDGIGQYVTSTEHLLRAVGDRLSAAAVAALAEGVTAGEDIEQLRARLRSMFARTGAELGDVREERIARTEASRAWNTATLAAGQALTDEDRPIVKQWTTRRDTLVREAHDDVDGQLQLLDDPFAVAGVAMQHPGDPSAPPELVCNCRCVLRLQRRPAEARAAAVRRAYAANLIPAGSPAAVARALGLHNIADRWQVAEESQAPAAAGASESKGTPVPQPVTAAADGSHLQGGMIALIPTEADAARLAVDGGEDAAELHLTLFYLGPDGSVWTDEQRQELTANLRAAAERLGGPITATAFGANHWNPGSDEPSWVWAVGDDRDRPDDAPTLTDAHTAAVSALEDMHDQPDLPTQHSPWVPHVCAAYSDDPALLAALVDRVGPITFDRIRLALGGDDTDIPLGPEEEPPMDEPTAAALTAAVPTRSWSTPDDAAIAFENEETGDGRIFAAGSLYWDAGPWPLQYADEMLMGHEGAELAGAIETVGRDGNRITAAGVLYPNRDAGADALTLLEEGAPLGVSVDLDDVDMEFVDRTLSEDEDGYLVLAASLASANLLQLEDGSWAVTAHTPAEWTASGNALTRTRQTVQFITGPHAVIAAQAVHGAFAGTRALTAAAGDADNPDDGVVVWKENAGDLLMRITRARLRGATLVSMPAYSNARIVLDPVQDDGAVVEETASSATLAADLSDAHRAVVAHVSASPVPVGARDVAAALGMEMEAVRGHLARAAEAGRIVRLGPGQYVGASTLPEGVAASASDDPLLLDLAAQSDLLASAWRAMSELPAMPAEWFREPTPEELPPGSKGVHYAQGRIFGWVAQSGVPHAGYPGKNITIDKLAKSGLDLTHFLRQEFALDDGTMVRAGAFTMNVPHRRDGAECNDAACQFDDSRTVAGVVTCGMNDGGLWFSGAAAPWVSEWDRTVFLACQPSYHLQQENGRWQLRAVLSVPVPGHSSPLLAAAVERSNLALAASAAAVLDTADTVRGHSTDTPDTGVRPGADTTAGQGGHRPDTAADTLAAALTTPSVLDRLLTALEQRETARAEAARAEVERLAAAVAPAREEIAASASGTDRKEAA